MPSNTKTSDADEQGAVGLPLGDEVGCGDADVGVGDVLLRGDTHVDDLGHPLVRLQVRPEPLLVVGPGIVAADDDPQARCHATHVPGASLSSRAASTSPTTRAHIASEVAPGSGVPTLFSASGRARPRRGRRSAVPAAASVATPAAEAQARDSGAPSFTSRSSWSVKGSSASIIVLSPSSALPSSCIRPAPARTACAAVVADPSVTSSPMAAPRARRNWPQSTPEVPPALPAHASPAAASTVATPAPASSGGRAASRACVTPLTIPRPWSPSPATASIRA